MASKLHDPSSSGFMDGTPTFAALIANLDTEVLLMTAVSKALEVGNESLQKELRSDERWKPWADNVRIEWDGSEFSYVLDGTPEDQEAMRAIEYGTQDAPPSPILRKHSFRLGVSTAKAVEDAMNEEVIGLG